MESEETFTKIYNQIEHGDPSGLGDFSGLELTSIKFAALKLATKPDFSLDNMEQANDDWELNGGEKEQVEANRVAFAFLKNQIESK